MTAKVANVIFRIILATGTLLCPILSAQSASYYVSAQNGNDGWSGTLPSPNSFNTDGPFQTLARAKAAMEGSSTKTVYIRAGTYTLTSKITFTSSDNGETWQNYPGEAPVIDGASTYQFILNAPSNMTFTGLTFQNYTTVVNAGQVGTFVGGHSSNMTWNYNTFLNSAQQAIMLWGDTSLTITNNTFNGQTGGDMGAFGNTWAVFLTAPMAATISHNSFSNLAGGAVALYGPTNTTLDSNYINGADRGPFTYGDIGVLYLTGHNGMNTQIKNNVILNTGPTANGVWATSVLYLDSGASNVTFSGNICQHCGTQAVRLHGGDHITFQNNIFDVSTAGTQLVLYQWDYGATDYGLCCNVFTKNLIYTSGSATGVILWNNQISSIDVLPAVSNNLYYAAGGGTWTDSNVGYYRDPTDSSPVYQNPFFADPAAANYAMPANSPAYTLIGFQSLATNQGPVPPSQQPPSQQPPQAQGGAPIANGTYTIKNNSSGLVLDDPGYAPPGVQVIQYSSNSGANQRWILTYVAASQAYTIVNQSSGGYLTDGQGQLFENPAAGDATQLWVISSGSGANVVQNVASGRVIDDPGLNPNALTQIITWPINGGVNQGWIFQ